MRAASRRSRLAEPAWTRSVGSRRQTEVEARRGGFLTWLFRALVVRLHEPEVLVDVPRDLREDVGGVFVAELVGLVDRAADLLSIGRQRRRERLHVVAAADDRERIRGQRRARRRGLDRALGLAAELNDPFGRQIHPLLGRFHDLVEKLVERGEVGSLHVPVRLLSLQHQVGGVRQPVGEHGDHFRAGLLGEIVLGGMHDSSCRGGPEGAPQRRDSMSDPTEDALD